MKRRLCAAAALVLLVCAALPCLALAVDDPLYPEDIQYTEEGVTLSKTATRTDADEWEITLAVTPEGESLVYDPLELGLVIDSSGSMQLCTGSHAGSCNESCVTRQEAVAEAAAAMVAALAGSDGISVGVAGFDKVGYVVATLTDVSTQAGVAEVIDAIPCDNSGAGTNITGGLSAGGSLFTAVSGVQRVLVLLSDGEYNRGGNPTNTANALKADGIKIYTIGFMIDDDVLEGLSSGEGYYKTVSDSVELVREYERIAASLSAGVVDPIADKFYIIGEPAVSFSGDAIPYTATATNGVVRVTPSAALTSGNTMYIRYKVKLDMDTVSASPTGIFTLEPLNGDAVLERSGESSLAFPLPKCRFELGNLSVCYELADSGSVTGSGGISQSKTVITDWGEPSFSWDVPATMTDAGVQYALDLAATRAAGGYSASAFDALSGSVVAAAGEHSVTFVYNCQPTPTPTVAPTPTPTVAPTPTPTVAPTPTPTVAPTPTPTATPHVWPSPRPTCYPQVPATGGAPLLLGAAVCLLGVLPLAALGLKRRK